jgi:histidyl-tRNA synthetase
MEELYCLPLLEAIRKAGIAAEIYPSSDKMKKQMNYANRKGVKYVILAGETEIAAGEVTIKNMMSGEQIRISTDQLVEVLC